MSTTPPAWLREALNTWPGDHIVTRSAAEDLLAHVTAALPDDPGTAWDRGYETAARCYWHKPRNPYTGAMNDDDPADYCTTHGGTSTTVCDADPRPGLDNPVPCPQEPTP